MLGEDSHLDAARQFTRAEIATAVEVLVGILDVLDPDPDLEADGDEFDGTSAEDEECGAGGIGSGAGCPISDDDTAVDDAACDPEAAY